MAAGCSTHGKTVGTRHIFRTRTRTRHQPLRCPLLVAQASPLRLHQQQQRPWPRKVLRQCQHCPQEPHQQKINGLPISQHPKALLMKESLLERVMGLKLMAPEKLVMKKVMMKRVVVVVVVVASQPHSQNRTRRSPG